MRRLVVSLLVLAGCASGTPRPDAPPAPVVPKAWSAAGTPWWNGAVFYEAFVRSFRDSDGDGKGDLAGLVSRLDYLNDGDPATTTDLGVDALWLMPVFASPSYHGYDTTDYEAVNPDYGTNADLDRLVAEAHRRGIRVLLDLVLNHTSDKHPWFAESASSPASPKRDWYVWRPDDPNWGPPWCEAGRSSWAPRNGQFYYAAFGPWMPDLNYRTAAVREEAKRLARRWLARGIDGFRLDAIRFLVEDGPCPDQADTAETHAFLKEFAKAVKEAKPDAVLVGEVWAVDSMTISDYYGAGGDELDVLFDFPLQKPLVEGLQAGSAITINSTLEDTLRTYPKGSVDAPFLSNHDQIRIASRLDGDPALLRTAAAVLLTLPGAPFVWQGEELGMRNPKSDLDEWKRTPLPWDAAQPNHGFTTAARPWERFAPGADRENVALEAADPKSLLHRYGALIRARHASAALRTGDMKVIAAPSAVLAFVRRTADETVLVTHNLGDSDEDFTTAGTGAAAAEAVFADDGATLSPAADGCRIHLAPHASAAWRLR